MEVVDNRWNMFYVFDKSVDRRSDRENIWKKYSLEFFLHVRMNLIYLVKVKLWISEYLLWYLKKIILIITAMFWNRSNNFFV